MSAASRKSSSGVWEFITTMLQNDSHDVDDVVIDTKWDNFLSYTDLKKGQPSFIFLATFLMLLYHHLSSSKKERTLETN